MNKKRFQDVDHLIQLRQVVPPTREYLYDYKLQEALKHREEFTKQEFRAKYKVDFEDLPISNTTLRALTQRKFRRMTEIQRCAIPHALAGRDILGASRTGSGKTLAYLIPLIEKLYISKWTPLDGLGAIVLLPTRELAMQVFEVFKSISSEHVLSVGLLIGGKNYEYERDRITGMNVLVCTPGRLLQHFEESPNFEATNLHVLVIDEADMMFELGFAGALRTLLKYLPKERQTMLFSATLSKDIHQLGSQLIDPELIYLHDAGQDSSKLEAPSRLKQFYMVVNVEEKIDILFSFIKSHTKQKMVIFVSTCKQVRFLFEAFKKLKMGIPLMELQGRQKQDKRTAIFFTFTEKRAACLITTNIASRGLDFPKVDWVINFDCPDDVHTYIHRVGRTARYTAGGFSLLLLQPSEALFAERLKAKGLQLEQKFPNTGKQLTIKQTLQSMVSENIELKYLAQRAFISYIRSVDINPDKEIFNVNNIKTDLLAESLGLVQTPVIEVVETQEVAPKQTKLQKLKEKIERKKQQSLEANKPVEQKHIKKIERQSELTRFDSMKNTTVKRDDALLGGLLRPREQVQEPEIEQEQPQFITSKRQLKKVKVDGIFGGRNKIYYDDEGNQITEEEKRRQEILKEQQDVIDNDKDFTHKFIQNLQEHEEDDRRNELERRKIKRKKRQPIE